MAMEANVDYIFGLVTSINVRATLNLFVVVFIQARLPHL